MWKNKISIYGQPEVTSYWIIPCFVSAFLSAGVIISLGSSITFFRRARLDNLSFAVSLFTSSFCKNIESRIKKYHRLQNKSSTMQHDTKDNGHFGNWKQEYIYLLKYMQHVSYEVCRIKSLALLISISINVWPQATVLSFQLLFCWVNSHKLNSPLKNDIQSCYCARQNNFSTGLQSKFNLDIIHDNPESLAERITINHCS